MAYSYITFAQIRSQLSQRLQDPLGVYFSPAQLDTAINESIRLLQLATATYKQKTTIQTSGSVAYYDLSQIPNSPLSYSVTDVQIANSVLRLLLEPELTAGQPWSGSGQFTLGQLQQSIQNRLNHFLGSTGCVVSQQTINTAAPQVDLISLPDPVIDVRRAAWVQPPSTNATYNVLYADQVSLIGIQSGSNRSFTLPIVPVPATSLELFLNGQLLQSGVDYILSGSTITYLPSAAVPGPADIQRASFRYQGSLISGTPPQTSPLGRIDEWSQQAYLPFGVQRPNVPLTYSVFESAPLQIRLVPPPQNSGLLDCIFVVCGPQVNLDPANPVLIGIPDDLSACLKWGALADMLGTDGPSRDYPRAEYAERKYQEYISLAKTYPSLLGCDFANVTGSWGSIFDLDTYYPNWQNESGPPSFLGMAGRNIAAIGPVPDNVYSIGAWVVANAPISGSPNVSRDQSYVQIQRDAIDPVLDMAQHIASFQMGGTEFDGTDRLRKNFVAYVQSQNARLDAVSIFRTAIQEPGNRSETQVRRMVTNQQNQ